MNQLIGRLGRLAADSVVQDPASRVRYRDIASICIVSDKRFSRSSVVPLTLLSSINHQPGSQPYQGGRLFHTSSISHRKFSPEDEEWIRKADEARKKNTKLTKVKRFLFGKTNVYERTLLFKKITEADRKRFVRPGVTSKAVMLRSKMFDEKADDNKSKDSFIAVINDAKIEKRILRTQYCEFIHASLKKMEEFGVERDLDTYKAILDVFPKDRYIARNMWQQGFFHFMKHQQTAIDLLEQMDHYGVLPDPEIEQLILRIFGKRSHAWKKIGRMIYWRSKFRYANPFPIPDAPDMPTDPMELARIAIKRMSVDVQTKISIFNTSHVKDATDNTYIVSAQSPVQSDIIADLKPGTTVYVDGPHRTWVRWHAIGYFTLVVDNPNAGLVKPKLLHSTRYKEKTFDIYDIPLSYFGGKSKEEGVAKLRSLHEQEDGTILSYCATGTSSPDSLLSWVRILESYNPNMKNLQVVFRLHSPTKEVATIGDDAQPKPPDNDPNEGDDKPKVRKPSDDHHDKDQFEAELIEKQKV